MLNLFAGKWGSVKPAARRYYMFTADLWYFQNIAKLFRINEIGKLSVRAIFILFFFFLVSVLPACSRQPDYETPVRIGPDVAVDLSKLKDNRPLFFAYHYKGKKINFFIVKIGDTVMSFLDACNSCYPYKRGYIYDNGMLVCRYCNEKYRMDEIATGIGSCYPIKLPGRVQDGRYLISVLILEKNASRF